MVFFALMISEKNHLEDEFFAELRLKGISQLGQVEKAIERNLWRNQCFYYEEKDIKFGLPIFPNSLENPLKTFNKHSLFLYILWLYTRIQIRRTQQL
jgi:hypothetical protein